jgi:hypothetical protein
MTSSPSLWSCVCFVTTNGGREPDLTQFDAGDGGPVVFNGHDSKPLGNRDRMSATRDHVTEPPARCGGGISMKLLGIPLLGELEQLGAADEVATEVELRAGLEILGVQRHGVDVTSSKRSASHGVIASAAAWYPVGSPSRMGWPKC